MLMHPLSHHEILGLIGPFVRTGRRVDLEKTDRAERRVVFKPIELEDFACGPGRLCEVLLLENPSAGLYRLTRQLTVTGGLQAVLMAEGAEPRELLERVESVPAGAHFKLAAETVIAISYRVNACADAARGSVQTARMIFTRGQALVRGLALTLDGAAVTGWPATIMLESQSGAAVDLPADILAVLGWEWGLLCRRATGWRASLRLSKRAAARGGYIEGKMETMVAHLAAVLARPPADFHDTLLRARWAVTFRRAIPLMAFCGFIGGAFALRFVTVVPEAVLRLLAMFVPPALLVIGFTMRDRPALEVPPLPRRLTAAAW